MSTVPPPVEVSPIADLSVDEIESRDDLRLCGACGEAQIYGNVALIRLGFSQTAVCADCWRLFLDAVAAADGVVQLPPVPTSEPGAPP